MKGMYEQLLTSKLTPITEREINRQMNIQQRFWYYCSIGKKEYIDRLWKEI